MPDKVNHPKHYTQHPSGVECIEITEHFNFNLGNAIKYIWRADDKDDPVENLNKAIWYLNREIHRRKVKDTRDTSTWRRALNEAAPQVQVKQEVCF